MKGMSTFDTPLKRLFDDHPHARVLWPTKAALDVQLHRLFGDGCGSGNKRRYQPYQLRTAVVYRLLQAAGLSVARESTYRLRLAIENAVWLDRTVSVDLGKARIVLDVSPALWDELVPS